jgi:hypothetical protein
MPKLDSVTEEKRYFDLEEANEMIPWLDHTFAAICKLRARMERSSTDLVDTVHSEIEDRLNELIAKGLEVVDIELGIINFYTWDEDEEVVLSWQYGETEIHFWHEPFEDFCHRRPLKQITTEAPKMGPMVH